MKFLKRIGLTFIITIFVLVATVYLVWIPGPQEPPYTLVKTWGEKGTGPGQFNEPTGIAVSDDEVFVSDSRNKRIQVFDFEGNFKRMIGNSDQLTAQLARPMNLTIVNKKLYVADYFNDQINVYALNGIYQRSIGESGSNDGQFDAPSGVAVADNGDVFVADFYNQRAQQLRANGQFVRQWGLTKQIGVFDGKMNYPTDVAIGNDNTLYVADGYNDRILAYNIEGELIHKWGGPLAINIFGPFNGWFATVTGVAVGPQGNVFVADFYNDRVQKFTPDGKFISKFGIKSSAPTHTAIAVSIADDGTAFVADYANHQVQKWTPGDT